MWRGPLITKPWPTKMYNNYFVQLPMSQIVSRFMIINNLKLNEFMYCSIYLNSDT